MMNEIAYVDKAGRFVVPARFRKQMGWEFGDKLTLEVVENELSVVSIKQAIRSAQEMVAQRVPAGVSLVDELLEDRKSEVRREEATLAVAEMPPAGELEGARG